MSPFLLPDVRTLADLFRYRCSQKPNQLAYASVRENLDLERQLTYGELERTVTLLANHLAQRVRPGTRVLFLFPSGLDVICAFWACICAGLVPVPAPAPDPVRRKHSLPRLRGIIEDAQVSLVLTTAGIKNVSSELLIANDGGQIEWMATDQLYDHADAVELPHLKETTLAYLQYTSGSTATPRGVMVSHGNVLSHCKALSLAGGVSDRSRSLCWLPYFHDYGLLHGIIAPFYAGIPAYLMSPVTFLRRPLRWLEAVSRFSITHSGGPNFSYESCLRSARQNPEWRADLSAWTVASCGAEPIHADTVERFIKTFGPQGFRRTSFTPAYGLAEATLVVTMKRAEVEPTFLKVEAEALAGSMVKESSASGKGVRTLVGCGEPLEETCVLIVNPMTQRSCQPDEVGEVWLAGAGIAGGYWGRQEESDAMFKAILAGPGEGLYLRTGDLGFIHQGELFLTGRLKDLIIVRGRNHYPQDLELTAEQSHLALRPGGGAAFSVENPAGEQVVVVHEVDRQIAPDRMEEIYSTIRHHIAEQHELHVFDIVLIQSGSLPKTSSGKVQRTACKAAYLSETLSVVGQSRMDPSFVLSELNSLTRERLASLAEEQRATFVEDQLRIIVAQAVGVAPPTILLDRTLGAFGLDSLMAVALKIQIEESLHVSVPLSTLLHGATVKSLAILILQLLPEFPVSTGDVAVDCELSNRRESNGGLPLLIEISRQGTLPLSFAQRRLWFLERLEPNNYFLNIPMAARLSGNLDIHLLEQCLQEIVQRHEVLRTTFPAVQGEPHQVILPRLNLSLSLIDLRSLPEESRRAEQVRLEREASEQPFDLAQGPLIRGTLLYLGEEDHLFLLCLHHIVADGWSIRVLVQELTALYQSRLVLASHVLPRLTVQYADYAVWERACSEAGLYRQQLDYWTHRLAGAPELLQLPTDWPRSRVQRHRGAVYARVLSHDLPAAIKECTMRSGATRFSILLTAFAVLLSKYSGQQDIVIGCPLAHRSRKELEGQIGLFVNTVALRIDLSDDPTVAALLDQARRISGEALDHQDIPFEQVVEKIRPSRDLSRAPIFQVMCSWEPRVSAGRLGEACLTRQDLPQRTAQVDLTLSLREEGEGILAGFEYDTDLFESSTIKDWFDRWENILRGIAMKPEARLSELSWMEAAEQKRVLEDWNATAVAFSSPQRLHELFEAQVERTPEATALVFGEQHLTYRELNHRANQLAAYLHMIGVTVETVVACAFDRSPELVVGLLAILKAGGAYLPIDPRYPRDRISFMLQDAQAEIILTVRRLMETFEAKQAQVVCLDRDYAVWSELRGENLRHPSDPTDLASVIYTSGSTGRPKGVEVEHRSLVNHANAIIERYGLGPSDRVLQFASPSFDVAAEEIFPTLASGGAIVLNGAESLIASLEFLQFVDRAGITVLNLPAPYWSELVMQADRAGQPIPCGVRLMVVGSDRVRPESLETWRRLTHNRIRWCNAYGVTEATITTTIYEPKVESSALDELNVSIGQPLANTKLYVLDRYLHPVPIGVAGELYIGGVGVTRGYCNRPDLTRERFLPNPFQAGERFYRTGDLARYRSTGDVELLGRDDDQVKLRGFRIELGEIEAVARACSGVEDAIALVREDRSGKQRVVLYFQSDKESGENFSGVQAYLVDRLPEFMVPSAWVKIISWPRTPNGKIDRRALPDPDTEMVPEGRVVVAPRSSTEQALAEIWKAVLNIGEVSIHDHFFELGGHSLLATQVASRIREAFELELSLQSLFEKTTIAELAEEVERVRRRSQAVSVVSPIVPVSRSQPLPLSFSQRRMWLMYQMAPKSTAYNMPFASRQMGPLNMSALRRTIDAICSRHEAFRTTFAMTGDEPVQIVGCTQPPYWVEVSLSGLPDEQRWGEAARLVEQEANQPFDLEKGPLARFLLIEVEPEDHVLMLTMHHIIGDQWSFGVIGREFAFLYNALCQGETPSLAPLPFQYADYAVWQRHFLTDEWLSTQSEYWQKRLVGLSPLLLPTDYSRPVIQTFNGSQCMMDLPFTLIERLKHFSAERNATAFMTLLACFQILLSRYSGQQDVAVGFPIANRTQSAVESVVGSFVNTLVFRTDLSGNPTFEEMLERVRETAIGAYANQDFPFEKLVETIHSRRDHSAPPLVQVLFNLANTPIGEINVHGLTWVPFEADPGAAQFDLSLTIETEIARKAYMTFNTDLFERQTAERMLGQYGALLHSALEDPKARISELSMLSASERTQLLEGWNLTQGDYPHFECVPQLFEAQVERTPDAVAVSMEGQALSYRALNARANQMARALSAQGVTREVIVGICLERSLEKLVALLAVWKAGGAYLPLDPNFPRDRLRFMAEDAGISLVVTTTALSDLFDFQDCRVLCLDRARDSFAREEEHCLPPIASFNDLAYVLYTSGSTGQPKAVEITHRSLVNFLWSMKRKPGCSAQDIFLSVTTLSFDIAGLELYLPLLVGGRVEIVSRAVAMDGYRLRKLFDAIQPTLMQATPATWRLLLDAGWTGSSSLTALCGGEALPVDLAVKLLERSKALWNMYGPTETTIWSTIAKIEPGVREITIGRPIANTEIYVLDRYLQPVPIGVSGELYIGGHGLARGYRRRPELTDERFIANPFSSASGSKLYRTGDLARYRQDGCLVHLGRIDRQVKIRGFRIELGEAEAVLSRHPAVRQVVVTAREDQQGLKQLVAYVVCQEGQQQSSTELRSFMRAALPDYMTPSFFVFLEAMPLTANNKVDVQALPAPVLSVSGAPGFVEPRDQLEVQLTALWQQVLGVSKIGVHDNFFDLGGHSLKAAQLFYLLEQVYGRHLPLATLFQAPTIAVLASVLSREHWMPPWQSLVAIQPSGSAMPIFMVPGIGGSVLVFAQLARLLGPDQPVYGLQARRLDGTEAPFTSVPEMAKHYIGEMRTCRPEGPYAIIGACTGGLIAYEMAQQLFEQGEAVTLIVLDSWHPSSYRSHRDKWRMRLWVPLFVFWRTVGNIRLLLRMPMKGWWTFIWRKSERFLSFLRRRPAESGLFIEFQLERMKQSTFHAVARYALRNYPGRILNIVASKHSVPNEVRDTRYVWDQLASQGCQTVHVAAAHAGFLLASPHVEEVSSHIQAFLAVDAQDKIASDGPTRDVVA